MKFSKLDISITKLTVSQDKDILLQLYLTAVTSGADAKIQKISWTYNNYINV